MGRREQFTVGELTITKGMKAGLSEKFFKVLKFYSVVPAVIVADRYVVSANMKVGAYTLANSGLPGDGLAHNVTVAETITDAAEDTNGTITITGLDIDGKIITEDIIPNGGATIQGTKAFKQVTSVVGAGWVQNGATPDTIVVGFGEVVGLPDYLDATADVLMVAHNTALINAPTVTQSCSVLASNTVLVPTGDGTKVLRVLYQV